MNTLKVFANFFLYHLTFNFPNMLIMNKIYVMIDVPIRAHLTFGNLSYRKIDNNGVFITKS
jgi:hypothetical protein